jgi:hypothetical protein
MSEHVEFEIGSIDGYRKLEAVTSALVMSKRTDDWKDEAFWLGYFDAAARSHFWWPTPDELEDWQRRWFSTPAITRFTDPSLKTPWIFDSMIDAFKNGDYELLGCQKISDNIGRFEFAPHGYPYGGTGCMRALIEAFDHRVLYEPDA